MSNWYRAIQTLLVCVSLSLLLAKASIGCGLLRCPHDATESSPLYITNKSTIDALTFDPSKGQFGTISYTLSRPAWIRIRITLRDDPELILRTLVDWEKKPRGKNIERWDGRDQSDNIIEPKRCFITIDGLKGPHKDHYWAKCKELRVNITTPLSKSPIKGTITITATLGRGNRGYGEESGYEVSWYADYISVHKDTYRPTDKTFTFDWDTTTLEDGPHLITVNINDHHDHIGTASIRLNVKNHE